MLMLYELLFDSSSVERQAEYWVVNKEAELLGKCFEGAAQSRLFLRLGSIGGRRLQIPRYP